MLGALLVGALLYPVAARAATAADRLTTETMSVGSTPRTYDLFVPANYDQPGAVHGLALVFHGMGSTNESLEKYVVPAASAHGIVVAFPQGIGNSWNAGGCCGSARGANVDDLGFAHQLASLLTARFHPRTVIAAGYSNGAMLSWYLACQPHSFVAGVVDASGTEAIDEPACNPHRRILVSAVHGRHDPVVPYQGGGNPAWEAETGSGPFRAITSVITEWGQDHQRCQSAVSTHVPGWSTIHWSACPDGSSVTLYTIDGMGHDVPNYAAGAPVDFGSLIVDATARAR